MSTTAPGLVPRPPSRISGVRRLNRWPLILVAFAVALIISVIIYVFYERSAQQQVVAAKQETDETTGAADIGQQRFRVEPPRRTQQTPGNTSPQQQQTQKPAEKPTDLAEQARADAWRAYYQQVAQEQQRLVQQASDANKSDTEVELNRGSGGGSGDIRMATPGVPGAAPGAPIAGVDAEAQAQKRAFLNQGGDVLGLNEELPGSTHGPKSDHIMQGTAIAGVMVGGMNSDMPGMIIGQITQPVCDSQYGAHLLIPQGTKVVGTYDNSVSNGQTRIGFIWNRLIFPDTSSRQLGSMQGADEAGYAGAHDRVNTHFWEKFGAALMVSIVGAGVQLAQPPPSPNSIYSPWSTGTGAFTQQMSNFGTQQAQGALSIPNTLEVRPGYPFRLMVQHDVALAPYHGMACDGSAESSSTPIKLGPIYR